MRLRDAPFPLPPFFYPTRVLHVDDHAEFLSQLPLITPSDIELVGFTSARAAHRAFEQSLQRAAVARPEEFTPPGKAIGLTGVVQRILFDDSRFAAYSVVIADLTMPEMDGLDFLRGFASTAVGRILLSGRQAAEQAQVAFNEGRIERFVDKGHADLPEQLADAINALRWRYFMRRHAALIEQLTRADFTCLRDPIFVEALKHRLVPLDAVEMYAHDRPHGLLFLDARGSAAFLAVQTSAQRLQYNAQAEHAPISPDVLSGLRDGALMAVRQAPEDAMGASHIAPLYIPATQIRGLLDDYTVGIVPDLAPFELHRVRSYEDWLWQQAEPAAVH